MIKFEGSTLYQFENMPLLYGDREYLVSGVAEISYEGEAEHLISKNYIGTLSCEVDGFVDLYVEDENGKPPVVITEDMLNEMANSLAETYSDQLIDACSEDSMKWLKPDDIQS